jgi:hypothetical protein
VLSGVHKLGEIYWVAVDLVASPGGPCVLEVQRCQFLTTVTMKFIVVLKRHAVLHGNLNTFQWSIISPFSTLAKACPLHLQIMSSYSEHGGKTFFWNIKFLPDYKTVHFKRLYLPSNSLEYLKSAMCDIDVCSTHSRRQRGRRANTRIHAEQHHLLDSRRCQHCWETCVSLASVRYLGHCSNVWTEFLGLFIPLFRYLFP